MENAKTSLSDSSSVEELGEFWGSHDLSDFESFTAPAFFTVALEEPVFLFSIQPELGEKLRAVSKERGVSAETLLNLWLKERVMQETMP